jgi:hypothetical protein
LLHVYLAALGFGGTLLVASLVMGGKDAGADQDAGDAGGDDTDQGHADHGGGGGAEMVWTVARSLRFWTFLFAFGGGVGALLTALGASSTVVIAVAAAAVGLAAGVLATTVMRAASGAASSAVGASELAGASGVVTVAIAPGSIGKIRVEAKGRALDLVAETDDTIALPTGAEVLVVSGSPDGRVQVTRAVN